MVERNAQLVSRRPLAGMGIQKNAGRSKLQATLPDEREARVMR
jgi:hypothetical protein